MSEFEKMTPAEIDSAWNTARAPYFKLHDRWTGLLTKAAKYRKGGGRYAAQADGFEKDAQVVATQMHETREAIDAPFLMEWHRRGGWNRAYIVPDGHIHKSMGCHSLYPTTRIAWLPELSGKSEDEIVAYAGIHACTICYPSAPVEALRAEAEAAKKATQCPGSGTYEHTNWHRTSYTGSGRAKCDHCEQVVGTSTTGKLRAHKPVA